jgi:UDP-glucose 4-epimerase
MNILISGGFGYIGSYIAKKFFEEGHTVGIITKEIPPHFEDFSKSFEVYIQDITKPIKLDLSRKYDLLIHLAAANDVDSKDPSVSLEVTTFGTRNILEFCAIQRIDKIVYFSTFHVYGFDEGCISEDTPLKPKDDYAITHMFAEEYVKLYSRKIDLKYAIVRPTNVFGKFLSRNIDRWTLVPNCFIKEIFEKQTITLMSSGKQKRDYISLGDLYLGLKMICDRIEVAPNETYNLSSGAVYSIREIAEMVRVLYMKRTGKCAEQVILSTLPKKTEDLVVANTKLRNLGFIPNTSFNIESEISGIFDLIEKRDR